MRPHFVLSLYIINRHTRQLIYSPSSLNLPLPRCQEELVGGPCQFSPTSLAVDADASLIPLTIHGAQIEPRWYKARPRLQNRCMMDELETRSSPFIYHARRRCGSLFSQRTCGLVDKINKTRTGSNLKTKANEIYSTTNYNKFI